MNIYEKMSLISSEITNVAKNLEVGWNSNKYKAVSEGDVLAKVKPIERKHGIFSYPYSRRVIESGVMENTDRQGNVKKNNFLRIETVYRFVNIEKPDESIDITTYGDGVDSQDKAPGKAMTYGDKYALLKAYKIITGDDPDAEASGELVKKTAKKSDLEKQIAITEKVYSDAGYDFNEFLKKCGTTREKLTEKTLGQLNQWLREKMEGRNE